MEKIITEIISFFKNESVNKISKMFIATVIFFSILFIDNISGFSYYYNIDNKLTQLEKVSKLLENDKLDPKARHKIIAIQNDILDHKTIKDKVFETWSKISFTDSNSEILNKLDSSVQIRNSTVEFFSLNYFFVLLFVFLPMFWLLKPLVQNFWKNILIIIAVEIFLGILMFSLFLISSLIPTIYNEPIYNYILNFLIITIGLTLNSIRLYRKNQGFS